MLHNLRNLLFTVAVGCSGVTAFGFSLNGPLDTEWQTDRLGYNVNVGYIPDFGVMTIGEEYRFNSPDIHFGFSSDFANFFGQRGIDEVERAVAILNALPRASQLNIDDFPLRSQRSNHRAQALGMMDVHSFALSTLVKGMGLTDPTRYVFTLRTRWIGPGGAPTNYFVIKRNFDPVTLQHSSVINGQLWTYNQIIDEIVQGSSKVINEAVDPLALFGATHAPVTMDGGGFIRVGLLLGGFWTGLTRDDAGGLKYIYKRSNFNVENSPVGATGGGGGPWSIPGGTNTNNLVDVALRGGVDKITYKRVSFDSLLGSFFEPFTNAYEETIYVNAQPIKQTVQRSVAAPDILFDADDVTGGDGEDSVQQGIITLLDWDNNNDINGSQATPNAGPGVIPTSQGITPGFVITLNTVGPVFFNVWPFFLSETENLGVLPVWGSFDGSTNAPTVYPVGTDIELLEQELLNRPWLPAQPPTNLTNAPPENGVEPPPGDPPPPEPPPEN